MTDAPALAGARAKKIGQLVAVWWGNVPEGGGVVTIDLKLSGKRLALARGRAGIAEDGEATLLLSVDRGIYDRWVGREFRPQDFWRLVDWLRGAEARRRGVIPAGPLLKLGEESSA